MDPTWRVLDSVKLRKNELHANHLYRRATQCGDESLAQNRACREFSDFNPRWKVIFLADRRGQLRSPGRNEPATKADAMDFPSSVIIDFRKRICRGTRPSFHLSQIDAPKRDRVTASGGRIDVKRQTVTGIQATSSILRRGIYHFPAPYDLAAAMKG